MGLFSLLFLVVVLSAGMQVEIYRTASLYLEDALAASNLASAIINLEEYGISHTVEIEDPMAAYAIYCDAVKENLGLNQLWEGENKTLISGAVTVETYIVYNVKQENVEVKEIKGNVLVNTWNGRVGTVRAPNGTEIENTSIYSEISFPVKGMFGITIEAHKGKLVDIVQVD